MNLRSVLRRNLSRTAVTNKKMSSLPISKEDMLSAMERVRPYVHRTPVLTSETLDKRAGDGRKLFFKCENFQKTGAFKARGATNAILK